MVAVIDTILCFLGLHQTQLTEPVHALGSIYFRTRCLHCDKILDIHWMRRL